jgi:hypothetical protein
MENIDISIAYQGSLYVVYAPLRLIAVQTYHDAKENIVVAPLTIILPWTYLQYGSIHFRIIYQ